MSFGVKNGPPTYQIITKAFNDFTMYNDIDNHLHKLKLCFQKCEEYGISLNLEKCAFMVFSWMIFGFIVSREGKLLNPKKNNK